MCFRSGEDVIGRALLARPPFDLDVGLQTERHVKTHHQIAARHVEALLCHTRCYQHTVLASFEVCDLIHLCVVPLLDLQQQLPHLRIVQFGHLGVQVPVLCYLPWLLGLIQVFHEVAMPQEDSVYILLS